MHTILIAEAGDHALRAHGDELMLDGYEIHTAQTHRHARAKLTAVKLDALLLGTLDSTPASLALLRDLRSGAIPQADPRLPVVSIGPGNAEHTAIRHYRAGADIVLPENSSPLLISGALTALHARTEGELARRRHLRVGSLTLDCDARLATVNGQPLALTRLEFDLLQTLARQPHTVLTRQQLAQQVWNTGYIAGRTIDSHAGRLRTKLSDAGAEPLLQTVRGVGYRLGR